MAALKLSAYCPIDNLIPNTDFKRKDEDGFPLKVEVFILELKLINRFKAKRTNAV